MKDNEIIAIVAIGDNFEIGKDNQLLWRIPEDLKRFKSLTMGHPIIMGRKTRESLPRPLPGRTNIVITRNPDYESEGCLIASTPEEAIEIARRVPGGDKIFIIGGGEIYNRMFPLVDRLEITHVYEDYEEADTWFPEITMEEWKLAEMSDLNDIEGLPVYGFETYLRKI